MKDNKMGFKKLRKKKKVYNLKVISLFWHFFSIQFDSLYLLHNHYSLVGFYKVYRPPFPILYSQLDLPIWYSKFLISSLFLLSK